MAAWCSRTDVPVPPEVVAGWSRQPDVRSYLLVDSGRPVGYGEVWTDDDKEVEPARIIVDPRRRGQHLGRVLVRHLAAEAGRIHPTIFLRVRPELC